MPRWVRVERQHVLTRRLHNDSVKTKRIKVPFSRFIWGWGLIRRVGVVGWSRRSGSRERERRLTSTAAGDRRASTEHNHAYLYYTLHDDVTYQTVRPLLHSATLPPPQTDPSRIVTCSVEPGVEIDEVVLFHTTHQGGRSLTPSPKSLDHRNSLPTIWKSTERL